MNLMFWKKKPRAEEDTGSPEKETDNDKTVAMEVPDLDARPKTGLLARLKGGFSRLVRRFRKSPPPEGEETEEAHASNEESSPETQTGESPAIHPARTKKRLIIGGAIGLLILLLSGAGFATWKIFFSAPEPEIAEPATATASHDKPPETQAETEPTEIEMLRKKNEELQAQIEALKNETQQDEPSTPTADGGTKRGSATSSAPEEMTLSNKDPKAAAQSLKEAIEAMNAGSAGPARKPAKQKPPAEAGGD